MSKNETGHAKNIANANLLCTHIAELQSKYNPSNQKLLLANLQNIYNTAFTHQETVNNSVAPYSLAVDHREKLFLFTILDGNSPQYKAISKIKFKKP